MATIILQPLLPPIEHKHFCADLAEIGVEMMDDPRIHLVIDMGTMEWLHTDGKLEQAGAMSGSDLHCLQSRFEQHFGRHRLLSRSEALNWLVRCYHIGKYEQFIPAQAEAS